LRITLAVAAVAPFIGTLFYGYVYDDSVIVLHNPVVKGWGSLIEVWKHPCWTGGGVDAGGLYRPLCMTFLAIIWNGAHGFAIAFHLFVILLHAAVTLLLWRLLRRSVGQWAAVSAAL